MIYKGSTVGHVVKICISKDARDVDMTLWLELPVGYKSLEGTWRAVDVILFSFKLNDRPAESAMPLP